MAIKQVCWRSRLLAVLSAMAVRRLETGRANLTHSVARRPFSVPSFALVTLIALVASAFAIAALAQWTNIDLWIANLYYDPVRRVFPWYGTWFARDFMHGYLKQIIVWFGFLTIAAMLIDLAYPLFQKSPLRRLQWRFVALAAVLEPSLVRGLKESSNLHCPVWALIFTAVARRCCVCSTPCHPIGTPGTASRPGMPALVCGSPPWPFSGYRHTRGEHWPYSSQACPSA